MSIYVSLLTAGTNSHEETSENANAVATDFFSAGVIGSITNTSGVAPSTGAFAVNAQGTPNMTVAVSSGVAYVTGTPTSQNSQLLRVRNSASANVTISANSSGSTKYDFVYIKLDASKLAAPGVNADDVATLVTSRSSSSTSDNGTPPTYGLLLGVVAVANGASSITNGNITDKRVQATAASTQAGWIPVADSWAYSSYDSTNKTGVITVPTDATLTYSAGMRVRFVNNSSTQYGIITKVASTALTIYFGTGYSLTNATISSIFYSYQKAPFGFPLDPTKWTVITTYTSNTSQVATANTWYNIGSVSISAPIGIWMANYALAVESTKSSSSAEAAATLSTSSSSESDANNTSFVANSITGATAIDNTFQLSKVIPYPIVATSATTYYLNERTRSSSTTLTLTGGLGSVYIRLLCAYL